MFPLLPIALFVASMVVIHKATHSPATQKLLPAPSPVVSQGVRVVSQTQALPKHIQHLMYCLRNGIEPERWLIDAATSDAYNAGRWDIVHSIARRFPSVDSPSEETPSESSVHEPNQDFVGTVVGKNSPFDGVSNDEWSTFVDRLATQPDDFSTPRHVGRYHHSRSRLKQLGIDPDSLTPDQQYDALVADLSDNEKQARSLIGDYICQPLTVNGRDCVITMSGLLALLKSAGPEKARSWLENESDRTQFPKTTEMFLQGNEIF